jgi:hypothetical protein
MIDHSEELRAQQREIERFIMKLKKREKNHEALPEGSLRVTSSGRFPQYFFRKQGTEKSVYLPAKDKNMVGRIIQRDYDRKALQKLDELKKELDRFMSHYDAKALERLYGGLCEGRKRFVDPLEITDGMFIERWMEENQGEKNPYPEPGKYETEKGEIVRSKSEKILADIFHKMRIPYRYEPQVCLNDHRYVYPDFVCLNVRKRKTVYWEHLGLINVNEYANKCYAKLEEYERNGILLGDSLVISMETPENPLNVSQIRRKIELFLK